MVKLVGFLIIAMGPSDVPEVHELVISPEERIIANTIAGESRGEATYGQACVADVIYERSMRRGLSAKAVCLEANQFAGSSYKGTVSQYQIWLAKQLVQGKDILPDRTFTHFYSGAFAPYWAEGKNVLRIGNHYFLEL